MERAGLSSLWSRSKSFIFNTGILLAYSAIRFLKRRLQGNGHSANATAFAAEIGDYPAAPALLNILYGERGQLGPAQSAAHQQISERQPRHTL